MQEIRKYPVIYDRYIKDFKGQNKKRNAWENVSKGTGLSVAECQKRYKNIRTNYVRNVKKKKPSGSEGTASHSDESHHLQWLDAFVEHRQSFTDFSIPSASTSAASDTESSEVGADEQHQGEQQLFNIEDSNSGDTSSNISASPVSLASSSVVESVENLKRFTSEQRIGNNSDSGMSSTKRQRSKVSKKVKKADVDSVFFYKQLTLSGGQLIRVSVL